MFNENWASRCTVVQRLANSPEVCGKSARFVTNFGEFIRLFVSLNLNSLVSSALCSLILVISAFAQSETAYKPRIAVIAFTESDKATYGGAELTDMLTKELTDSGKFSVVDRSKAAAVGAELKSGRNDSLDPSLFAEIGRKTGAQYLVLGTLLEYSEKVKTSLFGVKSYDAIVRFKFSVVNAVTGEVALSQTIEKRGVSMGESKNVTGTYVSKGMQDAIGKSVKDAVAAVVKHLGSSQSVTK